MGRTAFTSNSVINGNRSTSFNGAAPVVTGTGLASQYISARQTANTPNFKVYKKISARRRHELPFNPFLFVQERVIGGQGDIREHDLLHPEQFVVESGFHSNFFGGCTGDTVLEPDTDMVNKLYDRVNAKILEKLKDQSVNVAQVFAERKLTADLIGDTAIRLASSFSALKKGDIRGAARRLGVGVSRRKTTAFNREYGRNKNRAISNGWLELQYGWRPLLQDVYGSAEFLAKKQSHEIHRVVRSKITQPFSDDSYGPASPNYWDVLIEKQSSFDYNCTVRFTTTGAELASAKEAGLLNPLSLGWELLPFSFVVDWFLPVGNYLNSLDATIGLSFNSGCYTTFLKGYSNVTLIADNRRGANRYYSQSVFNCRVKSSRKIVRCIRTPMLGFPSPVFPSFKNPFSFEHALNGIALLFQTFKR